jgi:hypothetical protein
LCTYSASILTVFFFRSGASKGDTDRVSDAAVRGHRGLEARDMRPEDELLARDDLAERLPDRTADRGVLRLQVEERDSHAGRSGNTMAA